MAETNIFSRLKRLFSTNVIVRNVGGKTLKISDTNKVQAVARRYLTDRFTRLYSNMGYGSTLFADSQFKQTQRLGLFKDYEDPKYNNYKHLFSSIEMREKVFVQGLE